MQVEGWWQAAWWPGMRDGGHVEMLETWGTPGGGNRGSAGDVGDTRWRGWRRGTVRWGHRDAGDIGW